MQGKPPKWPLALGGCSPPAPWRRRQHSRDWALSCLSLAVAGGWIPTPCCVTVTCCGWQSCWSNMQSRAASRPLPPARLHGICTAAPSSPWPPRSSTVVSQVKPLHRPPPAPGDGLCSGNCFLLPFSSLFPLLASWFLPPSLLEWENPSGAAGGSWKPQRCWRQLWFGWWVLSWLLAWSRAGKGCAATWFRPGTRGNTPH